MLLGIEKSPFSASAPIELFFSTINGILPSMFILFNAVKCKLSRLLF